MLIFLQRAKISSDGEWEGPERRGIQAKEQVTQE
jgi:hypothetical protein